MRFEKLSDEERERWIELSESEYDPDNEFGLDEDDFYLLIAIITNAVYGDFDWLTRSVAGNAADVARLKDNPRFDALLRRAYEHGVACGHGGCCCNLGNRYHDVDCNGSAEDYATAVELYEMGADLGDAQASVNLGYIYYYGRGTAVDYAKAYECYARAALACGHPEGYCKLGDLYAGGRGVRQSDWMAWIMYSKAYENGKNTVYVCRAAHHMADMLMKGIEGKLKKDPDRALRLYVEAELSYYDAIDSGLTYYGKCLRQAIEGQRLARAAVEERHRKIRAGEE